MKKIIFVVLFMILASVASHAQVAVGSSDFEFRGGKFYQNGIVIAPGQLPAVLGQQTYDSGYLPAKKMRVAGISCLSAGGGVTALGAGLIIAGAVGGNSSGGSAFGGMVSVGTGAIMAGCGAAVAITGGILLGSANKKLKNLRPASGGAGISMVF